MNFTPLTFNTTEKLTYKEVEPHHIDKHGRSPLYPDSIFSVILHKPAKVSFLSTPPTYTEMKWSVTRLPKEDIELPLDKAIKLTWQQTSALLIKENGNSDRPEFNGYTFKTFSPDIGKTFYVMQTKK